MSHLFQAAAGLIILGCLGSAAAQTGPSGAGDREALPPGLGAAVRAARQAEEYAVVKEPLDASGLSTWLAKNRAHGLRASFLEDSVCVEVLEGPSEHALVTLALVAWGRQGATQPVEPAVIVADSARVEYRRGPLVEWYVNAPCGIEQGFTIAAPPSGGDRSALLELQLALGGSLAAEVTEDGRGVRLIDQQGVKRMSYTQLAAWDATGRPLSARLEVSGGPLSILVDTANALFPITVDPILATQEAKLIASDAAPSDWFGHSVAISGDTAIVGSPRDDDYGIQSGSAYIFVRSGGAWTQQAKLTASDAAQSDAFGIAVAISGDTAVIGADHDNSPLGSAGSAYVFVRNSGGWAEQAKLTALDGNTGDTFGYSVAISDNTVVVGAVHDEPPYPSALLDSGSVYVFVRTGGIWIPQAKLTAPAAKYDDQFGYAIAIRGETAIIGCPMDDEGGPGATEPPTNAGAAFVYVRSGGVWTYQQKLIGYDSDQGDTFGRAIAMSGETAIIGSTKNVGSSFHVGAAYVFVASGGTWAQQAMLTPPGTGGLGYFGDSVGLSADTAVVGAFGSSRAYVFVRSGTSWSEQAKLLETPPSWANFGFSVAVSNDTIVVGAPKDTHAGGSEAGSAYVFALGGFKDLGGGLAGVNGVPTLAGIGTLVVGSGGSLTLANTDPSVMSALFVSVANSPTPFLGGTLHTVPVAFQLLLMTSPTGGWTLPWTSWPDGLPVGSKLYFQAAIADPAAMYGVSLSNLLEATQP